MNQSEFPYYERPPVVEMILGVQFDPLPSLKNAHLGAFWSGLGSEWPMVNDAPTLEPQFERFGEDETWSKLGVRLRLSNDPATRIQVTSTNNDRMLQVQNGRLHYNWLAQSEIPYARYPSVREGFTKSLDAFRQFLKVNNLGEVKVNQWEVTYVNQIPKESVWQSPADWSFFKLLGSTSSMKDLCRLENFNGEWHFEIPDKAGRLHVQWRHGMNVGEKQQETVLLTLTARGPANDHEGNGLSLSEGHDLGRAVIVNFFKSEMSDDANKYWGLKHANT